MQETFSADDTDPTLWINEPGSAPLLAEEAVIALFVNGRHKETLVIWPEDLDEYIIGYLFSEEVIAAADDIESIQSQKNRISVLTRDPFRITGRRRTILSGCGGSTSTIDTSKLPVIQGEYAIAASAILGMIPLLPGPFQVAFLADEDGLITKFRDISCTAAVDKVLGYGLAAGVSFSASFLLISEMITSEMVRRCLLAGIPILISTGLVTKLAEEIAEEKNLCIGSLFTRDNGAILTHPERIRGSGRSPS